MRARAASESDFMSDSERIRDIEAKLASAEARLEANARVQHHAEIAITGVHHRIRNVLARVRSIAGHSAAYSPDLAEFMAHFDGRLAALSRLQSILMRSGANTVDFEEIVREEFLAISNVHSAQISIEGEPTLLESGIAEPLALAVHELTTNALKFGALAHGGGALRVKWDVADDEFAFEWVETGAPRTAAKERDGFGRELILDGLPFQIGARTSLEFTPDGVQCRINCPLRGGPRKPSG